MSQQAIFSSSHSFIGNCYENKDIWEAGCNLEVQHLALRFSRQNAFLMGWLDVLSFHMSSFNMWACEYKCELLPLRSHCYSDISLPAFRILNVWDDLLDCYIDLLNHSCAYNLEFSMAQTWLKNHHGNIILFYRMVNVISDHYHERHL